jgi:hypothetical protein
LVNLDIVFETLAIILVKHFIPNIFLLSDACRVQGRKSVADALTRFILTIHIQISCGLLGSRISHLVGQSLDMD